MVQTNYSFKTISDKMARAYGKSLPISTKVSINICNALRGMTVDKALAYLQDVVDEKRAIPFTRFNDGVGHRPGMAAGRYPRKASLAIARVIASAATNAAAKGLSSDLKIISLVANKASSPLHYGRQRRRSMKRTHIEVVVEERSSKKGLSAKKTVAQKASNEAKSSPSQKQRKTILNPLQKIPQLKKSIK
jgi:large subunit ribosomal protein L22